MSGPGKPVGDGSPLRIVSDAELLLHVVAATRALADLDANERCNVLLYAAVLNALDGVAPESHVAMFDLLGQAVRGPLGLAARRLLADWQTLQAVAPEAVQ